MIRVQYGDHIITANVHGTIRCESDGRLIGSATDFGILVQDIDVHFTQVHGDQ